MLHRQEKTGAGPLRGVRVLDFTRVLAGPAASLALADLGAEVLKIEPPGSGDDTRTFPPFRDGESHYFLSGNRGKKSIVIDLKRSEEHTSELQSLMRISYAVFCLKKKTNKTNRRILI